MSSARLKATIKVQRVVINDACCLIDLHKVDLITAMLRLPYRFVVALPVRQNEVLDFTPKQWKAFEAAGLEEIDLTPAQVGRALQLKEQNTKLSAEDTFSFVLAQDIADSVLLTGDAILREAATRDGREVHGILWVLDELHKHGVLPPQRLARCCTTWLDDPLVRLPATLVQTRIRAWSKK